MKMLPLSAPATTFASEATIDRLEAITGGAEEPLVYDRKMQRSVDALDASTDEELDALKVNLMQDDNLPNAHDGSGRIVDDVAEERLAEFTEVGPNLADEGVLSVVPGRDDTSATIRRHHPDSSVGRSDAIVEGNIEDTMDETKSDSKADEGTGA